MTGMEKEFNRIFHEQIPLVGNGIKIDVLEADEACVKVRVPMDGNGNDKGTLFAGASYSALVVAGWCLVMARARACGFERPWAAVVEAHCRYVKAVRADSVAVVTFSESAEPKVGARNWLKVSGHIGDAVVFEGTYAVGQHRLQM